MRFDDRLRERLRANLAGHDRLAVPAGDRRPAAVVLTVHEHAGEAGFLITRRAVRMSSHSSQWALPGGRIDTGETVVDAALRELDEELAVREVEVLGLLDDYATRSGYCITPVVAWAPAGVDPVPNPAEVAEVHHVPLADLDRPEVPRWAQVPELADPVIQIPIVGTYVHAPTGAIIYQFREVAVHGRSLRVDHLDEPPFAWR
jgi:8-oxo-dGTP pyrophosphatase MutT (NUDIX family)